MRNTERRKPTPKNLKVLRGNPGRRPIKEEPRPTPKPPAIPKWLSREGKAEWKRLVPELERMQILTLIDGPSLAGYCEAWATLKEATLLIKAEGITLETERGAIIANPAVRIQAQASATIKAIASEFGLTPYSRSRLSAPEVSEDEAESILTPAKRAS